MSSSLAVLGIFTGIWDIADGVGDIKGSDHAMAYMNSAKTIDDGTKNYKEFLATIMK